MDVSDMLDDFGTDIKVWRAFDQPQVAYPGGPTVDVDLSDENAEKRHEPVLPLNSNSSLGRKLIAGGGKLEGTLVWYSTDHYPTGTVVEIPDQFGKYKVTQYSNFNPYSHFFEYVLEGDDQDGIGE
ncbi:MULTISPECIES: hypothetical protein [Lactobacillus]|uniref:Uncharacterized protein n=2 Tax=Lactobacillus xujianguonis TaxID=2495899 RepID=A0A437ST29_9LACO|nr:MULTISPECIES: hypothetical protein [Lactobacillus]RVU70014.1 hypothetical protein EJK17_09775 [Lactobacillus xujianguonis]